MKDLLAATDRPDAADRACSPASGSWCWWSCRTSSMFEILVPPLSAGGRDGRAEGRSTPLTTTARCSAGIDISWLGTSRIDFKVFLRTIWSRRCVTASPSSLAYPLAYYLAKVADAQTLPTFLLLLF